MTVDELTSVLGVGAGSSSEEMADKEATTEAEHHHHEEDDEETSLELGPQCSLREQLEKDKVWFASRSISSILHFSSLKYCCLLY